MMHCMAGQTNLFAGINVGPIFFWISLIALAAFLWIVMSKTQMQQLQVHQDNLKRMLDLLEDAYQEGRIDRTTYLKQRNRLLGK